jgi:hypothetical protein
MLEKFIFYLQHPKEAAFHWRLGTHTASADSERMATIAALLALAED